MVSVNSKEENSWDFRPYYVLEFSLCTEESQVPTPAGNKTNPPFVPFDLLILGPFC